MKLSTEEIRLVRTILLEHGDTIEEEMREHFEDTLGIMPSRSKALDDLQEKLQNWEDKEPGCWDLEFEDPSFEDLIGEEVTDYFDEHLEVIGMAKFPDREKLAKWDSTGWLGEDLKELGLDCNSVLVATKAKDGETYVYLLGDSGVMFTNI